MRVLFLQRQPCIRALKYAVALRSARPDISLAFAYQGITLTEFYGSGDELFDQWWNLGTEAHPAMALRQAVAEFQPDLIHSHNLPDSLTVLALEALDGDIPVIHDVHDMQSLRRTPYHDGFPEPADPVAMEKRAIEGSAALVTISPELVDEIAARYELPEDVLTFANYALARDLPAELPTTMADVSRPLRVVYEGSLGADGGHYDLRAIFSALVQQGVQLDIYPARPAVEYETLAGNTPGMRYHEPLEPSELLKRLPEYDFGWAGFNAGLNGAHLDTCLPNKVFEYVGCGLPILTLGHAALVRLIREEGIGVSLDRVDTLSERLANVDLGELRERIAACRHRLTTEANIRRLLALYERVAGLGEVSDPEIAAVGFEPTTRGL